MVVTDLAYSFKFCAGHGFEVAEDLQHFLLECPLTETQRKCSGHDLLDLTSKPSGQKAKAMSTVAQVRMAPIFVKTKLCQVRCCS